MLKRALDEASLIGHGSLDLQGYPAAEVLRHGIGAPFVRILGVHRLPQARVHHQAVPWLREHVADGTIEAVDVADVGRLALW